MKKIKSGFLLTCLFTVILTISVSLTAGDIPFRSYEPPDSIITDLKSYIPERMSEGNVPGLAIALIRDFQVIWIEGFGVTNRITKKPVTIETVFEVASISKIDYIQSYSMESVSYVMIAFELDKEIYLALQEVKDKVDGIVNELPENAETPVVKRYDPTLSSVVDIIFSGSFV